ncbi:MAG: hypothetical protein ACFB16_17395 [Phormidesmis sp.]
MSGQSEKAAYEAAIDAKVEKLEAQITAWQAKADLAKADAKVKYQEQIAELQSKQVDLKEKLASVKSATDSAWAEMKLGVESAWSELQIAFDKAKSKIDQA